MNKSLIAAVATAATLLAAGTARASDVYWSIGISAPPIGTVISNGPVYAPAPIYAPVPVYSPPPVIYTPPPVVYRPAPRVVYPAPVVVSRPVPISYGYYGRGPGGGDRDHPGGRRRPGDCAGGSAGHLRPLRPVGRVPEPPARRCRIGAGDRPGNRPSAGGFGERR